MTDVKSEFMCDSYWGFAKVPQGGEKEEFVGALCNAVAADGVASDAEIKWIQGHSTLKGCDDALIAKIPDMAHSSEKKTLDDVVASMGNHSEATKKASRIVIFDALRASLVDGLAEAELEAITKMAAAFGVSKEDVLKLKDLAEKEEALKKERLAVIFPQGHPCLHPKHNP